MINPNYKKPKTGSGDLRTPVRFYEFIPNEGPEPGDEPKKVVFKTMCEAYNPSMKDLELLNSSNTKQALTILMRDPLKQFQPNNKSVVEVLDFSYAGLFWDVSNISHDPNNHKFIKVILSRSE